MSRERTSCLVLMVVGLLLSTGLARAQTGGGAQLQYFQHLVCNYFESEGELALVLQSISHRTDPKAVPDLAGALGVQFEVGGRSELVEPRKMKAVTLNSYRNRMTDAQYKLFRFNLVIDESSSIKDAELAQTREIISHFLQNIPVVYEAQVIRFASKVTPPSCFTNDRVKLREALGLDEPARRLTGETAFYNALDRAVRELSDYEDVPLQFTIAFTDGKDTTGRDFGAFRRKLQQTLRHEQIYLFVAGIGKLERKDSTRLAQLTGGMGIYQRLPDIGQLTKLFDIVEETLAKTYILRIPTLSSHAGAKKLFIMKQRSDGRYKTLQDIELPARCVPP